MLHLTFIYFRCALLSSLQITVAQNFPTLRNILMFYMFYEQIQFFWKYGRLTVELISFFFLAI